MMVDIPPCGHTGFVWVVAAALGCALACASDGDGGRAGDLDARGGASLTAECPVVDFAPCGGTLEGTSWTIASFCPQDAEAKAALYEHPYDNLPECADRTLNTVDADVATHGSVSFENGALTVTLSSKTELAYGFTDACLAATTRDPAAPAAICDGLGQRGSLTCRYASGRCTCDGTLDEPAEASSAPFAVEGQQLVSDGHRADYCAEGDVLVLDWISHPVSWRYWVLTREP